MSRCFENYFLSPSLYFPFNNMATNCSPGPGRETTSSWSDAEVQCLKSSEGDRVRSSATAVWTVCLSYPLTFCQCGPSCQGLGAGWGSWVSAVSLGKETFGIGQHVREGLNCSVCSFLICPHMVKVRCVGWGCGGVAPHIQVSRAEEFFCFC